MDLFSKYRKEILTLSILIIIYFVLRLPNLTLQPIFADEAIYIRWSQVMKSEPTLRFLPISDGKTPLFMWIMIPMFRIFSDPLFAGRFLSIIAGLFTLLGVFALSWKFIDKKVALWATLFYVIMPYTVFFDRMALVDSMLATFSIWGLYFAIWLAQSVRLDLSMILGFILGGGILTKTPGMFNLFLLPLSFLVFKGNPSDQYRLVRLLLFCTVAISIALFMYNVLRLGPEFNHLSSRNADYVFSPFELVGRPLDPFLPHLRDMIDWFPKILSWPVIGVFFIGLYYVIRIKERILFIVLFWALIPLIIEMALLKTFTARYLLSSIAPLLIITGYGMEKLSQMVQVFKTRLEVKSILFVVIIFLVVIQPIRFDYILLTNPQNVPLPREEKIGYFEDWTAGYGFKEIANYLIEKRNFGPVVVGTEGYFGTLPDGLYIYLDKADIAVVGGQATVSAKLLEATEENQTFFVVNKSRLLEHQKNLKLIMEFPKAKPPFKDADAIQLFEVIGE